MVRRQTSLCSLGEQGLSLNKRLRMRARVAAKRLHVVSVQLVRESSVLYPPRFVQTPDDATFLLRDFIETQDRDMYVLLGLDAKNQRTMVQTVGIGTINSCLVHPQEVFKVAILSNATSVIVAHGHPSALSAPSDDDKAITQRLVESGIIYRRL